MAPTANLTASPPTCETNGNGNGDKWLAGAPWWGRALVKQGAWGIVTLGVLGFIAFYVVVPLVSASIERADKESTAKIALWAAIERTMPEMQLLAKSAAASSKAAADSAMEAKEALVKITAVERQQSEWQATWQEQVAKRHEVMIKQLDRSLAVADEVLRCAKEAKEAKRTMNTQPASGGGP